MHPPAQAQIDPFSAYPAPRRIAWRVAEASKGGEGDDEITEYRIHLYIVVQDTNTIHGYTSVTPSSNLRLSYARARATLGGALRVPYIRRGACHLGKCHPD